MDLKKKLGIRIKELRIRQGMKQAEVAEKAGIAAKHQSYIETGKNYPSSKLIEKYAEIFNIDVEDVLKVGHIKERKELIPEIINMLENADDSTLVTVYKILKDILY